MRAMPIRYSSALRKSGGRNPASSGFTLAEVAVTILVIGIGLVMVMQSLHGTKLTAAHTRNQRLANDLARLTLGKVAAGYFWDELEDDRHEGDFYEEGYPEFYFEVLCGEEEEFFDDRYEDDQEGPFPWSRNDYSDDDDEEDEEVEQAYVLVRVRVTFPQIREYENKITLEWNVPPAQIYGEGDEDELQ